MNIKITRFILSKEKMLDPNILFRPTEKMQRIGNEILEQYKSRIKKDGKGGFLVEGVSLNLEREDKKVFYNSVIEKDGFFQKEYSKKDKGMYIEKITTCTVSGNGKANSEQFFSQAKDAIGIEGFELMNFSEEMENWRGKANNLMDEKADSSNGMPIPYEAA